MANGPPTPDIGPPPGAGGSEGSPQGGPEAQSIIRPVQPQESAADAAGKAEAARAQEIQRKEGPEEALREVAGQQPPETKPEDTIRMAGSDTAFDNAPESRGISTPANEGDANEGDANAKKPEDNLSGLNDDQLLARGVALNSARNVYQQRLGEDLSELERADVERELQKVQEDLATFEAEMDTRGGIAGKGKNAPKVEEPAPDTGTPPVEAAATEAPPAVATEGGGVGAGEPPVPEAATPAPEPRDGEDAGAGAGEPPEATPHGEAPEMTEEERLLAALGRMTPEQLQRRIDNFDRMVSTIDRRLDRVVNLDDMERLQDQRDAIQANRELFEEELDSRGVAPATTGRRGGRVTAENLAEARRRQGEELQDRKEIESQTAEQLLKTRKTDTAMRDALEKRLEDRNLDPADRIVAEEAKRRLDARIDIAEGLMPEAEVKEAEKWRKDLEDQSIDDITKKDGELEGREKELTDKTNLTTEETNELQNIQRQRRELGHVLSRKKAEAVKTVDTEMAKKTEEEKIKHSTSTKIFNEVRTRQTDIDKLRKEIKNIRDKLNGKGITGKQSEKLNNQLYELTTRLQGEQEILGMYKEALYKSDAEFRAMDSDERSAELLKIGQEIDLDKFDYDALRQKALAGKNLTKEDLAALGAKMAGKFIEKGAKSMFNSEGVSLAEMRKIFALRPELQKYVADRLTADKGFEEMVKDKIPNAQKLLRWAKNNPHWLMIILAILAGTMVGVPALATAAASVTQKGAPKSIF